MKFPLLLATALVLSSCKSDQSTEPEVPEKKPSRSIEQAKLLNQKYELQQQLDRIVATSQVDPDGQMQTVIQENRQAINDRLKILNTHPSFQKLNADLRYWRAHANSARSRKSEEEAKMAAKHVIDLNTKLSNLSKDLPAIREADDRIERSEKQIQELRRTLAEQTPAGREIIEKMNELDRQIRGM